MRNALIVFFLFIVGACTIVKSAEPLPLTMVALSPVLDTYYPPVPSPDGSAFAYVKCIFHENDPSKDLPSILVRDSLGCAVVVASRTGTTIRRLQEGSTGAVWSPNSALLAFLCPNGQKFAICIWSRKTDTVRMFGAIEPSASFFLSLQWLPDSRMLVFESKPHALTGNIPGNASGDVITRLRVFRSRENMAAQPNHDPYDVPDATEAYPSGPSTIYALDTRSGSARAVAHLSISRVVFAVAPHVPLLAIAEPLEIGNGYDWLLPSKRHQNIPPNTRFRIINIATGATVRTFANVREQVPGINWSPDGTRLAWFGETGGTEHHLEPFVADIRNGYSGLAISGAQPFDAGIYEISPPLWSADGKHLLVVPELVNQFAPSTVWAIDLASHKAHRIFEDNDFHIDELVSVPCGSVAWTPRGTHDVVFHATRITNLNEAIISVNLNTHTARTLIEGSASYQTLTGDDNGDRLILIQQRADIPPDIYALDVMHGDTLAMLTDEAQRFRGYQLGKAKLLSFTNTRGQKLHAAILLPPDYTPGKPVPTVAYVYGSVYNSVHIHHFGFGETMYGYENLQALATRGIAVLLPDMPYYGVTPMEDDLGDVMPAIDAAVAAGYTDPNKLGVMGHSHGGFDVYALVAQSKRFKAGVARAGFADWTSLATEMEADGYPYGMYVAMEDKYALGADPWSAPQRYVSESPLYKFQNVNAAMLIIQQNDDLAVRPENAEEAFVALRQLHKNVELALYPQANHTEDWLAMKYQIDYLQRMVSWFVRYL